MLVLATGCTQPPDEVQAILKRDGYVDVKVEGYAWFGCGEDDTFRTKFSGTKNGQYVEGVVCSGFLKGSTVRTFS